MGKLAKDYMGILYYIFFFNFLSAWNYFKVKDLKIKTTEKNKKVFKNSVIYGYKSLF